MCQPRVQRDCQAIRSQLGPGGVSTGTGFPPLGLPRPGRGRENVSDPPRAWTPHHAHSGGPSCLSPSADLLPSTGSQPSAQCTDTGGHSGYRGVVSRPAFRASPQGCCGRRTSHLASLENWVFSGDPRNSNTHREAWGSYDCIRNVLRPEPSLKQAPTTPASLLVTAVIIHPGSRLIPSCSGTDRPGAEQAGSPDRGAAHTFSHPLAPLDLGSQWSPLQAGKQQAPGLRFCEKEGTRSLGWSTPS